MIDLLPEIRWCAQRARPDPLFIPEVLDVGTDTGAGADLLARLHRGDLILWPKMKVDGFDIDATCKDSAMENCTAIREYIVNPGGLHCLEPAERAWDIVVCSHVIEHLADPGPLILECRRRARHFAIFYAPFEEKPLLPYHLFRVKRRWVKGLRPVRWGLNYSPGWQPPHQSNVWRAVWFTLPGMASK
jgi:2-polyprenyl-3-methyl-5-hydroxy-6-metoxy-1,4-benzoquinol methylase